jgi:hypothetical protein
MLLVNQPSAKDHTTATVLARHKIVYRGQTGAALRGMRNDREISQNIRS